MTTKETKVIVSAETSRYERGMRNMQRTNAKTTQAINMQWASSGKAMKQAMLLGVGALVAFGKIANDKFKSYETALVDMGKVTNRSFKDLTADIAGLPKEIGSSTELMKGYYQVISAGITEPKAALELLTTASKAAKAAHIEQSEVIKGLTKVMKGYEGQIKTTADAADLLFTLEKVGQTTVAELIPHIGGLAKISHDLGISQYELAGSLAQITQLAGGTDEAVVQYQGVLTGLMKPTTDMKEATKAMGFESSQAAIQSLGFAGVLKKLKEATGGSAEKMAALFPKIRGLKGIAALSVGSFGDLTTKINEMTNGVNAADDAFERWKKTSAAIEELFRNKISGVLREIGEKNAPKIKEFLEFFSDWLTDNKDSITNTFGGMAAGLGLSLKALQEYAKIWQTLGWISSGNRGLMPEYQEKPNLPSAADIRKANEYDEGLLGGGSGGFPKSKGTDGISAMGGDITKADAKALEAANMEFQMASIAKSEMEIFLESEKYQALKDMGQEHREWEMEALTESTEYKQAMMQTEHDTALEMIQWQTEQKARIEKRYLDQKLAWTKDNHKRTLQFTQGTFNTLMNLSQGHNKTIFEVSKAAATANAIVSTYAGAANAMRDVPYPFNFVAAASVLAYGFAQVAQIRSQSFDSGGGVPGGSGGATGGGTYTSPTVTTDASMYQPAESQEDKRGTLTINIQGDFIGDEGYIEMLAEKISEAVEDRDVTLIASNSKYADVIA